MPVVSPVTSSSTPVSIDRDGEQDLDFGFGDLDGITFSWRSREVPVLLDEH